MLACLYADWAGIILNCSLLSEARSVTEPGTSSASLGANLLARSWVHLPRTGIKHLCVHAQACVRPHAHSWRLFVGTGELNSDLHSCPASALPREPSPHPNLNNCKTFVGVCCSFSVCLRYLHFWFYTKTRSLTIFKQKADIMKDSLGYFIDLREVKREERTDQS